MPEHKKPRENGLLESFDHAMRGLMLCVRQERNFRIHLIVGFLVLFGSIFLDLSLVEFYVLLLVVAAVLTLEMINSALERFSDLVNPEHNRRIREIKNITAACVLVSSFTAIVIGYLILGAHLPLKTSAALKAIAHSPWYLTVIGILATVGLVFVLKSALHSKSLFHGGMPSGHSAISFGLVTAIFFATGSPQVTCLALPLAILVAQSRVRRGVHTWLEVVFGGVVGSGLVTLCFELFYHH